MDNSRGLGGVLRAGIGLCVALDNSDLHASALPRSSRSGTIPLMLDRFFSVVPMPVFIIVVLVGFHFLKKTIMRRRARKLGVTSSPSSDMTLGTLSKVDPAEWKRLNEHHTPKVIGSIASLSTSVDAQLLAPAMPYALCNGEYLNSFGTSNVTFLSVMLRNDWGVTDRASLLRQIYDLLRLGHRAKFEKIRQESLKIPAANTHVNPGFSPDRWRQMHRFITNDRGSQTIDFTAWDLMRAANLTRSGEALGWISRDEAADTLALINHGLRTTYSSWKEIWEAFAVGRWFWLNEEGKEMASSDLHDQNRKEILTSSTGIWTRIPWDGTYPPPRYLLLDAAPNNFQLKPMSRLDWEDAPFWERELDNETCKRIQTRS